MNDVLMIVGIVAEVAVLSLLFRRKAWGTLPIFCAYIAWSVVTDSLNLAIILKVPASFNLAYFVEMGPDSLLQFLVLIELSWSALRPCRASLPRGTLVVVAAVIALAGVVIWPLAAMTVPPNLSTHAQIFVHVQQTVAILRVVCFLVMAGFSQVLSIGWKDLELQVATGLGFYSIITLLIAVIHSHQLGQDPSYAWLDLAGTACYIGTLCYWVFSFGTKEQKRKEFSPQMQQLLLLMGGEARASRVALNELPSEPSKKRIR